MAAADRELAKKCAFDARAPLNDMQGNGHIEELKLLKAMQLLVNAVQALAARAQMAGDCVIYYPPTTGYPYPVVTFLADRILRGERL